jgi:hypothetical protein
MRGGKSVTLSLIAKCPRGEAGLTDGISQEPLLTAWAPVILAKSGVLFNFGPTIGYVPVPSEGGSLLVRAGVF